MSLFFRKVLLSLSILLATTIFAEKSSVKLLGINKGFKIALKEAKKGSLDITILTTNGPQRGLILAVEEDMVIIKQMIDRFNSQIIYIRNSAITGMITH